MLAYLRNLFRSEEAAEVANTARFLARVDNELQRALATIEKMEEHIGNPALPTLSRFMDDADLLELAYEKERFCRAMQKKPEFFQRDESTAYQRVVATLDRLEQALKYDRSHPQLQEVDSIDLTYDNWLVDKRWAEQPMAFRL